VGVHSARIKMLEATGKARANSKSLAPVDQNFNQVRRLQENARRADEVHIKMRPTIANSANLNSDALPAKRFSVLM
jgi:hypothetical protein